MILKRALLPTLLLFLFSTLIPAQEPDKNAKDEESGKKTRNKQISTPEIFGLQSKGYKWAVFSRMYFPRLGSVNDILTSSGFKEIKPNHTSIGVEKLIYISDRPFFRFEVYKSTRSKTSYKDTTVSYNLMGAAFLINSFLVNKPRVNWLLTYGINHTWLNIYVEQNAGEDRPFFDFISAESSQLGLNCKLWNLQLGTQMNFLVTYRRIVLITGVNSGYYIPLGKTPDKWKSVLSEGNLVNGPKINPNGFYIGLNLSFMLSAETKRLSKRIINISRSAAERD
ncbi:MAG: hypothetical protein KJ607_08055 [Bacteroidetes bacterium]|nr:hypothetical protein [Bacteroidota bacterium]